MAGRRTPAPGGRLLGVITRYAVWICRCSARHLPSEDPCGRLSESFPGLQGLKLPVGFRLYWSSLKRSVARVRPATMMVSSASTTVSGVA